MRKSNFTEEQIAFALRQVEGGTAVEHVRRKLGVSEATFYRWKKQFGGVGVVDLRRLGCAPILGPGERGVCLDVV